MQVLDPKYHATWQKFTRECADQVVREQVNGMVKCVHANYPPLACPPPVFCQMFMDRLAVTARRLVKIVESIPQRIFDGDFGRWMAYLGMDGPEAATLLPLATRRAMKLATTFARPDVLVTRSGFKVVEINVSPYLGVGFPGRIVAVHDSSPYFEFLRSLKITPQAPDIGGLWRETIGSITRAGRDKESPVFFLAGAEISDDFTEDFGLPDFERLMRSCGYEFIKGNMKALDVQSTGVFFNGTRVDAVFAGITYQEMVRDGVPARLIHALADADERALIDFICPPINALFENKLTLELLSSERFSSLYSESERTLLRECIPYTERVSRRNVADALSNKERYVLKPATEYGGSGVMIGKRTPDVVWRANLANALLVPNAFVLQETVDDVWTYDVVAASSTESFSVCLGPMVFGHRYCGTMLRQLRYDGVPSVINAGTGAEVGVAFVGN